jgi:hypothetical protein
MVVRLKTATGVALGPQSGMREARLVPRDAPTPALPQRGREEIGEAVSCSPRPSGERAGERGTREETVVPRGAPTPALPQRGREEFGSLSCSLAPLGLRAQP